MSILRQDPETGEQYVDESQGLSEAEIVVIQNECLFIQVFGHTGIGKTHIAVDTTYDQAEFYRAGHILSNVHLSNPPDRVEVHLCRDVREMLRLAETLPGNKIILWDEPSKSVSSRQAHSTFNRVITRLTGDIRKSGVRCLVYTDQGFKSTDSLIRANNSFVVLPAKRLDQANRPLFYVWNDNSEAERQRARGLDGLRDSVMMSGRYPLQRIQSSYQTFEKIVLEMHYTISESEVPKKTDELAEWAREHDIDLSSMKSSTVKLTISRWNDAVNDLIPMGKKAENAIYTELVARSIIEE